MHKHVFIVSLALCAGCLPPEEVLPVALNLPVRGLWTNPAAGRAPEGSLEVANNVTFQAPGVLEPRRGFDQSAGTLSGSVNALTYYDGQLIAHHGTSSISRSSDDGANWTAYSGTFAVPDASTRVRFFQAESSLFAICSDGVYQLDSGTGTWRLTGAPKPLDGTATLRRTANETGFATANGQWAYRDVWGYRDANGRLQLSEVSGRVLVQNPANITATAANISKAGSAVVTVTATTHGFATGEYVDVTLGGSEANFAAGRFQVTVASATQFTYNDGGASATANPGANITYGFTSRNVTRTVPVPSGATTSHFLQVYRSPKSASATSEPNDSMGLVYERAPTGSEVAAGTLTVTDVAPDELRGAELYTSIRGLTANKARPPAAHDGAPFKSSVFYIDTQGVQATEHQLLAVGGTFGVQSGELIVWSDDLGLAQTWAVSLEAAAAENFGTTPAEYKMFTDGSAAQNVANTAKSIVRAINGATGNTTLYAEYISADGDVPGKFRVYGRSPSIAQYYVTGDAPAIIDYLSPAILRTFTISSALVRASNVVTVNTTSAHGLAVGMEVQLFLESAEANFSAGVKTVASIVDPDTFTYAETGANATSASSLHFFSDGRIAKASDNLDRSDRIAFSEPDEPWAVPAVNEIYATPAGVLPSKLVRLKRLTTTRDRLFVWSDAGLFQVSGDYPNFALSMVEDKLELIAAETAGAIDSRAYGLTDQGWVEVVETPRIIDTPIADTFQQLRKTASSALALYAFGVPYDGDRKFLGWVPDASSDTQADQAFVFHQDSQDWTRWPIDAKSGFVNPSNDKLYLGLNSGKVWIERKTGTSSGSNMLDYYQTTVSCHVTQSAGGTTPWVLVSSSSALFAAGDVFSNGGLYAFVTSVSAVSGSETRLFLAENPGFSHGSSTVYKQYDVIARWLRQDFGEPDLNKVVDSGVLRFRGPGDTTNVWHQLSLDFATNLATFEASQALTQTLTRDSDSPSVVPFVVPATKQRGAWIQPQVTHSLALRSPRIEGISLNGRLAGRVGGR